MKKFMYMLLGGLVALALVFGAAASFAQTDDGSDTTTPETETDEGATDDTTQTPATPGNGWNHHDFGGPVGGMNGDSEALAEALGITVEELEAAKTEARTAAINQAVADGLLTQEQADQLLANDAGRRWGHFGNQDTYLAEALGISVEELQAARNQVYADKLAEMVAAGTITQEQADLMLAQKAVQGYIDTAALQAAVQAVYEDAVAQALADGGITQAQADQLLSNQSFGFPGFGNGFGGHHHGHGGPGGFGGFPGSSSTPNNNSAPATTDSSSDA